MSASYSGSLKISYYLTKSINSDSLRASISLVMNAISLGSTW